VVGLKPTIGLVSRTGIVPISSTLDTSGPMTKSVIDNAILLDAMRGQDPSDSITEKAPSFEYDFVKASQNNSFKGVRLGAIKSLVATDSLYGEAIKTLRQNGAEVIEYEAPNIRFTGFLSLLNGDMKYDLPKYFNTYANDSFSGYDVQSVIDYNLKDSLLRMPYGQARLDGIIADTITRKGLKNIVEQLNQSATSFYTVPMETHHLDAVLTKNNYYAAYAAAAFYPCLTVPMGYSKNGEPANLTFVAPSFQEEKLYALAAAYESITKHRKLPSGYE